MILYVKQHVPFGANPVRIIECAACIHYGSVYKSCKLGTDSTYCPYWRPIYDLVR